MNEKADTWQIEYIPDKPLVPPNQQPTVNVLAAEIEPKLANALIRHLNKVSPLENLCHVKRIQKRFVEGKPQLSVILCQASEIGNQFNGLPKDIQELINSNQLSPFITKVCKYAATSREQWEEQCKLWPTSYHPPTYNINGITGFSEEDSQSVFSFMKMTLELAKSGDDSIVNAALIVDPSVQKIIASGHDQICSWRTSPDKTSLGNGFFTHPTFLSSYPDSKGMEVHETVFSNISPDKHYRSCINVSCLNPCRWSEQRLDSASSYYWHPLRHAAMVAIESSAERDRHLFPGIEQIGNKYPEVQAEQSYSTGSPAKKPKTDVANIKNEALNFNADESHSASSRPYLCTGYDIYLAWEPCTMCAMGLVHQRIRRIFFAFPNPSAGALGSVHRLQGEKSLNHHYAVFRVFPPNEVLGNVAVGR